MTSSIWSDSDDDQVPDPFIESAKQAFYAAKKRYGPLDAGPFVLDGEYSLENFQALSSALEPRWAMGWKNNKISIYGDCGEVHADVVELIRTEVELAPFFDHSETPEAFKDRGRRGLFRDKRSTFHTWQLTPSSQIGKEADSFFRSSANWGACKASGMAIEIAHLNESLAELCQNIVDWTRGEGRRANLAVGIKVNTKEPNERDPQLWLVVRDSSPMSSSAHCRVYEFGAGTGISPCQNLSDGPATPVEVKSTEAVEDCGCNVEFMVPADAKASSLVVDIPMGAALFDDLTPDAFEKTPLSDGYVGHLKSTGLKLDLGYIRHQIIKGLEYQRRRSF